MKKLKCALFLSLLLLLLAPGALGEGQTLYVHNPISTDRLHLRRGPRKGADSLGRFYNGTTVEVLGTENGFYHVRISADGAPVEGYMLGEYLSKTPVESALPDAFIYGTDANGHAAMRVQPDKGASAVAMLYDRMICSILGDIGEDWVYVRDDCSGLCGYVSTDEIVRLPADRAEQYAGESAYIRHPDGISEPIHLRAAPPL